MDNDNNIDNLNNIEPRIITNSYYSNYPNKNNLSNKNNNYQYGDSDFNYNYNYKQMNNDYKNNFLHLFFKKLLVLSNIEGNFVKVLIQVS
jgi:hypothetical protein